MFDFKEGDIAAINPLVLPELQRNPKFSGDLVVVEVNEKYIDLSNGKQCLSVVPRALVLVKSVNDEVTKDQDTKHQHQFVPGDVVECKYPSMVQQYLQKIKGLSRPEARQIAFGQRKISSVDSHSLRLVEYATWMPVDFFVKAKPVQLATETPPITPQGVKDMINNMTIPLSQFYSVAHQVKKRTKETVALHLAAEVGEISECLVQPERKGNIVEESVDAILCALDIIYLELGQTHGTSEVTREINRVFDIKLKKWLDTCK